VSRARTWLLLGPAVALAGVMLLVTFVPKASRAAELHPAETSATPPGWQVFRALPGEAYKARGRFFDNRTGCELDAAADINGSPKATRTACRFVRPDGTVKP
jgi:hypothetical protein